MDLAAILKLTPEADRPAVREAIEAMVAEARSKGESASGYTRRQIERATRELEESDKRVKALEAEIAKAKEATDKVKALEVERDALLPFKAESEKGKFRALVLKAVPLADEAYLEHLVSVTGVELDVTVKDGKPEYGLKSADKLKEWAEDPANAHRIKGEDSGDPWAGHNLLTPIAPPVNAGNGRLSNPALQAQLDALPPESQAIVQRRLGRG